MTHLIVTPHPLTLEGRVINTVVQLMPGESLAAFLGRAGVDLSQQDWVVSIGGAVVPALMWARTRPKHGQIIECRRVAGRDVFRALAFAVLAYYTFGLGATAAGGWAAGGGLGMFLAQTAVFMIGAAVINKVLPPQRARLNTYDQSTGSTYSLAGGRNRARLYEPLGLLFGTTKVVPDYAAQPYTFFEADEQFLSARFSGGINLGSITDLKIGDTPLHSFDDVFAMRDGFPSGNTVNIDWANVDTVDGAALTAPTVAPGAWVMRTTSPGTRHMALDFVASLYDMADNGAMNALSVSVDIERRLLPAGAFASVGTFAFTSASTRPVRRTVTLPDPGVSGQFEIRVRKREVDVAIGRKSNALEWQSLKSYQVAVAPVAGYPQYGLRIRASGQLNGTLDQLSWVATQAATQVWNGAAFVDQPTSNPGAQILQFARGLYDGEGRLQAGMGLPDDQIDIEQLKAFTLHCAANGYEFDHWFDSPLSCQDLMDSIAAVGLGSISDHSGKLGVVWAAAGQPIEAVVNMGNISAGSFSVEYVTRDVAEELEVSWFDRASSYKPRSLRILAPGVTVPSETARLSPSGVVTEAAAVQMARWTMGQNIWGRKSVSWEMDLEHLAFRRYSMVALSHDLTQWGYGGRVRSAINAAGVVTLELDDEVPAGATRYIGLRIPGEKGYRVFSVAAFSGTAHSLTLVGPWPAGVPLPGDSAANPAEDTLWIYDFKAEPGQRLRVVSIMPTDDMKGARIVAVPEPDALWAFMATGAYTASPAPAAAESLVASNVLVTQRRLDLNVTNDAELWVTFSVRGPFNSAQIWGAPDGEALQLLGQTVVPRFGPVLVGNDGIFVLEVRPFDQLGRPGTSVNINYDVTLGAIVSGSSAQLLRLAATAQLYTFNSAGAAAPAAQTITLSAQLVNLSGTASFVCTRYDASGTSLGTVVLGGTGNTRTLTAAQFDAAVYAVVQCSLGGFSDQVTLSRVQDGAGGSGVDGLSVSFDNESHTVPASDAGVVSSYTGSGARIVVYEGGVALVASASTTASAFRVGAPTQSPSATLTAGGVSYAGTTATIAAHSEMNNGVDLVTLSFPVTIYRADGSSVTIDKLQTITKSKQGAPGDPGSPATLLTLRKSADLFTFDTFGAAAPTSQTISFTATLSNLSGTATFVATRYNASNASLGTVTLGGSGNTRSMTAAQFGGAAYAVVAATLGASTDQVTINRLVSGPSTSGPVSPGYIEVRHDEAMPAVAGGIVQFRRDGTVYVDQGPISGASYPSLFGNWFIGGSSTVGDDYDVRVDALSTQGDVFGTFSVWLPFSAANPSWTFAVAEDVSDTYSDLLFNYYIRRRSDGLTMVIGNGYLWARSAA